MASQTEYTQKVVKIPEADLHRRVHDMLTAAGASEESAEACTRALVYASRVGLDSHGVRLTPHYCAMLKSGRIKKNPKLTVETTGPATAMLSADDGLGHYAAYAAMDKACELAAATGLGACAVTHSTHYGAASSYAVVGAEKGFISFSTTNTDKLVTLHGSARSFHGTNPLCVAAPVPGQKPWLMDFATSAFAFNKIRLASALGMTLPEGIAADEAGELTTDPAKTRMLLPIGGPDFGYKGAALGGLATLLSAILTGTTLDHLMISMFHADDVTTPRNLGHFLLAIDPARFVGRAAYGEAITRYLADLRTVATRPGETVLAPGDREWANEKVRQQEGLPIDLETAAFLRFAAG
ncbi:Ldh family oxidoreductase [Xanthobacteraceae bacterium Astr-EGSB]|uniref:Ldh family oxidoreductase n=1 Tax=Astrobacterium formosum TaxID=3069710 RepID=UPI0027B2E4A5|nr:Ldh family oxidoreductase [Xanthobacteraceae bacterium Astr-EGSB]